MKEGKLTKLEKGNLIKQIRHLKTDLKINTPKLRKKYKQLIESEIDLRSDKWTVIV